MSDVPLTEHRVVEQLLDSRRSCWLVLAERTELRVREGVTRGVSIKVLNWGVYYVSSHVRRMVRRSLIVSVKRRLKVLYA